MFQPVEILAAMDVDVGGALNAYRPPGNPTLDLEPGTNRGFEVKHENGLTSRGLKSRESYSSMLLNRPPRLASY
jgi:hypothetical protein